MSWSLGQELQPVIKPPITTQQLKDYAAASGDNNPIHLDERFAQEAGFPSVIVHGMLSMAFMGDALRFNFPETQFIVRRFKTRFRKVTFPGSEMTCGGSIKRVSDDGSLLVSLWAKDQAGELKSDGEAEIIPF